MEELVVLVGPFRRVDPSEVAEMTVLILGLFFHPLLSLTILILSIINVKTVLH